MILNAKPRLLNVGHPSGSKNETEASVISSPETLNSARGVSGAGC
jgi:hypothetical protein